MTKEQAIEKIDKTQNIYLNSDQKLVAKGIINSIPEGEDILNYFDFIMKRSDVGFKYDVSPELAIGRVAVVNEMQCFNINVKDEPSCDENKLIIGDNYEALKNLLLTHYEKIDVIYIDPPYNTQKSKEDGNGSAKEGEASKFIYKDKFGRNGWLNMMRDRLILARKLLAPSGIIFVSIDDTEQAYLKVLMDEIFGEDNFISSAPRMTKTSAAHSQLICNQHEYTLFYSKDITKVELKLFEHKVEGRYEKDRYFKKRGGYYAKHPLASDSMAYGSGLDDYSFDWKGKTWYAGKTKEKFEQRKNDDFSGGKWRWSWSKKLIDWAIKEDAIVEKSGNIYKKNYSKLEIAKPRGGGL